MQYFLIFRYFNKNNRNQSMQIIYLDICLFYVYILKCQIYIIDEIINNLRTRLIQEKLGGKYLLQRQEFQYRLSENYQRMDQSQENYHPKNLNSSAFKSTNSVQEQGIENVSGCRQGMILNECDMHIRKRKHDPELIMPKMLINGHENHLTRESVNQAPLIQRIQDLSKTQSKLTLVTSKSKDNVQNEQNQRQCYLKNKYNGQNYQKQDGDHPKITDMPIQAYIQNPQKQPQLKQTSSLSNPQNILPQPQLQPQAQLQPQVQAQHQQIPQQQQNYYYNDEQQQYNPFEYEQSGNQICDNKYLIQYGKNISSIIPNLHTQTTHYSLVTTDQIIKIIQFQIQQNIIPLTNFDKQWSLQLYYICHWNIDIVRQSIINNSEHKKLITYNPQYNVVNQIGKQDQICQVCCYKNKLINNICGHKLCLDCWFCYLGTMMLNNSDMIPKCPFLKCYSKMNIKLINYIFSNQEFKDLQKKYQNLIVFLYSQNKTTVKICSNQFCENKFYIKALSSKPMWCKCFTCVCTYCGQNYHYPIDCAQAKNWKNIISKLQNTQYFAMKNLLYKKCPNCNTNIQKIDGCDRMKCPICTYQFCWKCLMNYSNHAICGSNLIQENQMIKIQQQIYKMKYNGFQYDKRLMKTVNNVNVFQQYIGKISCIFNKNNLQKYVDKLLKFHQVPISDMRQLQKIVRLLRFCYQYLQNCQKFKFFRAKMKKFAKKVKQVKHVKQIKQEKQVNKNQYKKNNDNEQIGNKIKILPKQISKQFWFDIRKTQQIQKKQKIQENILQTKMKMMKQQLEMAQQEQKKQIDNQRIIITNRNAQLSQQKQKNKFKNTKTEMKKFQTELQKQCYQYQQKLSKICQVGNLLLCLISNNQDNQNQTFIVKNKIPFSSTFDQQTILQKNNQKIGLNSQFNQKMRKKDQFAYNQQDNTDFFAFKFFINPSNKSHEHQKDICKQYLNNRTNESKKQKIKQKKHKKLIQKQEQEQQINNNNNNSNNNQLLLILQEQISKLQSISEQRKIFEVCQQKQKNKKYPTHSQQTKQKKPWGLSWKYQQEGDFYEEKSSMKEEKKQTFSFKKVNNINLQEPNVFQQIPQKKQTKYEQQNKICSQSTNYIHVPRQSKNLIPPNSTRQNTLKQSTQIRQMAFQQIPKQKYKQQLNFKPKPGFDCIYQYEYQSSDQILLMSFNQERIQKMCKDIFQLAYDLQYKYYNIDFTIEFPDYPNQQQKIYMRFLEEKKKQMQMLQMCLRLQFENKKRNQMRDQFVELKNYVGKVISDDFQFTGI